MNCSLILLWILLSLVVAVETTSYDQLLDYIFEYHLLNESSYFRLTSGCIENFYTTRTNQGNPPRFCRLNNVEHLQQLTDTHSNIECEYYVANFRSNNSSNIASIDISSKHNCIRGGSSFSIVYHGSYSNRTHFIWCDSQYVKAESLYRLKCPTKEIADAGCGSLQVYLDYESHNAFQNSIAPMLPLHQLIPSGNSMSICPTKVFRRQPAELSVAANKSIIDCLNHGPLYLIGSSHMRYNWDAIVDRYLDGHNALLSLPQHHGDAWVGQVHFINNLFVMQLPALLDSICNTIHDSMDENDSDSATAATRFKRWRVVVQALSWDLDYHPVRNVLLYNASVPALVRSVRHLASQRCGRRIDFTWVTAVPVPPCTEISLRTDADSGTSKTQASRVCSAEGRGYRNNHAIAAANQYIVDQLKDITLKTDPVGLNKISGLKKAAKRKAAFAVNPRRFVRFVDAFGLIYPTHHESVCGLHYTCAQHKGGKKSKQQPSQQSTMSGKSVEILHTPGGDAVINAILESVCSVS